MIAGVTDLPASPKRRGDVEPRPGDYCYLPLLEEMGFLPSKEFADGADIQAYAKSIAGRFGFAKRGLFHTQFNTARWDGELGRWRVETNRGDELRPRFVIMAAGVLNIPKLPTSRLAQPMNNLLRLHI